MGHPRPLGGAGLRFPPPAPPPPSAGSADDDRRPRAANLQPRTTTASRGQRDRRPRAANLQPRTTTARPRTTTAGRERRISSRGRRPPAEDDDRRPRAANLQPGTTTASQDDDRRPRAANLQPRTPAPRGGVRSLDRGTTAAQAPRGGGVDPNRHSPSPGPENGREPPRDCSSRCGHARNPRARGLACAVLRDGPCHLIELGRLQ